MFYFTQEIKDKLIEIFKSINTTTYIGSLYNINISNDYGKRIISSKNNDTYINLGVFFSKEKLVELPIIIILLSYILKDRLTLNYIEKYKENIIKKLVSQKYGEKYLEPGAIITLEKKEEFEKEAEKESRLYFDKNYNEINEYIYNGIIVYLNTNNFIRISYKEIIDAINKIKEKEYKFNVDVNGILIDKKFFD